MPLSNETVFREFEETRVVDWQKENAPSAWTTSRAKRIFDVAVVLASAPILLPLLVLIALVIRLFSGAPILFRQARIGAFGRPFVIYKFRTMHSGNCDRSPTVAVLSAHQVTPVGHILRRSKLDELPQIFNVLIGNMSLVGPRPKVREQQLARLLCRPGITGAATLFFAREDSLFAQIPPDALPGYYRTVVLPVKQQIDADYMQSATLISDLRILSRTLIGRWGPSTSTAAVRLEHTEALRFMHDACETQSCK
jgi:lipopolysaccharide/colanic/teichoic acid biosynthesis glycosyltransferase